MANRANNGDANGEVSGDVMLRYSAKFGHKFSNIVSRSSALAVFFASAVWMATIGVSHGQGVAAGAATATTTATTPAPIWLMGEVHDNPDGHAYRLRDLQAKVTADWRPAILMEQFDVARQAELTRAWQTCKEAQCVIDAAGGQGWQWDLYKPVIQLALAYRLPLVAVNLSRQELGQVMKEGFGSVFDANTIKAYGLDKPLPADWLKGQRIAIREGHCNALPQEMIDPMVNAQAARDVMFAKLLAEYAPQGAVLIAGNGHVRKDLGVYAWLPADVQSRVQVFGYVEPDGVSTTWYDQVRVVPAHPRPDPCEAFKRSRA